MTVLIFSRHNGADGEQYSRKAHAHATGTLHVVINPCTLQPNFIIFPSRTLC